VSSERSSPVSSGATQPIATADTWARLPAALALGEATNGSREMTPSWLVRVLATRGHHGAASPSSGNGSTPTVARPSATSRNTWIGLWQGVMGVVEP
jgi:hypothetical protein